MRHMYMVQLRYIISAVYIEGMHLPIGLPNRLATDT